VQNVHTSSTQLAIAVFPLTVIDSFLPQQAAPAPPNCCRVTVAQLQHCVRSSPTYRGSHRNDLCKVEVGGKLGINAQKAEETHEITVLVVFASAGITKRRKFRSGKRTKDKANCTYAPVSVGYQLNCLLTYWSPRLATVKVLLSSRSVIGRWLRAWWVLAMVAAAEIRMAKLDEASILDEKHKERGCVLQRYILKINVEEGRSRETEEKRDRNASLKVKNGPAKSDAMGRLRCRCPNELSLCQ
jgi:hypothetical protein